LSSDDNGWDLALIKLWQHHRVKMRAIGRGCENLVSSSVASKMNEVAADSPSNYDGTMPRTLISENSTASERIVLNHNDPPSWKHRDTGVASTSKNSNPPTQVSSNGVSKASSTLLLNKSASPFERHSLKYQLPSPNGFGNALSPNNPLYLLSPHPSLSSSVAGGSLKSQSTSAITRTSVFNSDAMGFMDTMLKDFSFDKNKHSPMI
jgi:hypothetical protein